MGLSQSPIEESFEKIHQSIWAYKVDCGKVIEDCGYSYGLSAVCLRYFNAAGADADLETGERHDPETHIIPLAIEAINNSEKSFKVFGDDYPTADGTCIRDYIHVSDLAKAHVLGLDYLDKNPGTHFFNLGTGSAI